MVRRYKFPLDLNDGSGEDNSYKGAILFQPYKIIPPQYSFTGTDQATRSTDNGDAEILSFANTAVEGANGLASSLLKGVEYPAAESCMLYLPPSIQVQDQVNLENVDLNIAGAGLEQALSSGQSGAAALKNYIEDVVSSVTDVFSANKSGDAARLIASRAAGGFGQPIAGAVASSLQTVQNPNTRVIFKSVNLREFSFTFKLLPKSKEESEEVKKIIHFFRRNLYPKTIKAGNLPVGYRFPNKFGITLSYGGRSMESLGHGKNLNFQKMYLRSFSTNYNPNNMVFFQDGNFTEIDMNMSFIESRALSFEDVSEEYRMNEDLNSLNV